MRHKLVSRTLLAVLITTLITGLAAAQGSASPTASVQAFGTGFTFQGHLETGNGPQAGLCDFEFSLWDSLQGGSQLGVTQALFDVELSSGNFTVVLNEANQFGNSAFNGDARWLEIAVNCSGGGGFTTLSPRQQLTPVPYALFAAEAGNAWRLTGNTGTNPGANFLGTTDDQPLVVRTGNQERLRVDAEGDVGIGMNNPADKLHVRNTTSGRAGFFQTNNPANGAASLSAVTNGRGSAMFANILNGSSTSPALHAIHSGNGEAGRFEGQLSIRRDNHQLQIYDSNNAGKTWTLTSHQETSGVGLWEDGQTGRLVVAAGGNVGIGTTNPQTPLHINGTAGTDILVNDGEFARMRMTATNPADDVTLSVQARGSDGPNRAEIGTVSNHNLVLYANGTVRMVIENDGDVCIGNC